MRCPIPVLAIVGLLSLTSTGCASSSGSGSAGSSSTAATGGEPCPVDPIPVVVSVDQWGDVVERLGGACTEVTTVIRGSSADPHDYEPTVADTAKFADARMIVLNGVDYDHWAEDTARALDPPPAIVSGGEVVGVEQGQNPHLWYSPEYVTRISSAITAELSALEPTAAGYFAARAAEWDEALVPYVDEITALRASSAGKPYGATESVFDDMATTIGLQDLTPAGFRSAATNGSEPAPGDIAAFQQALRERTMKVLVVNTQTEGSVPEQIREVAASAGVPVVEVTETVAPGAGSFIEWQLSQLRALRAALG